MGSPSHLALPARLPPTGLDTQVRVTWDSISCASSQCRHRFEARSVHRIDCREIGEWYCRLRPQKPGVLVLAECRKHLRQTHFECIEVEHAAHKPDLIEADAKEVFDEFDQSALGKIAAAIDVTLTRLVSCDQPLIVLRL